MQLALIAAMARNRVIGHNNALIWHLPEDLKHFKNTTSGHHIIMGRKTFESIGRPLPNRVNIVVSRNADLSIPGVMVTHSLEEAIQKSAADTQPFVVGGAQLYAAALPFATDLYLTHIDKDFEGDAFFPEFSMNDWQVVATETHQKEGPDGFTYSFVHYQRIAKSANL
jgi:dihydrofolate reductase